MQFAVRLLHNDPDGSDLIQDCGGEPALVQGDVVQHLDDALAGQAEPSGWTGEDSWLQGRIEEAFKVAKAMDDRHLTGAHLLVSLMSEEDSRVQKILRDRAMNLDRALDFLRSKDLR